MLSSKSITSPIHHAILSGCLCFAISIDATGAEGRLLQEPITPIPASIDHDAAKAKLGESLFVDIRLSKQGDMACASCHQLDHGGDDGLAFGLSSNAEQHIINTPSIFNAVFNFTHNWDGSAKTLAQQIDMAVRDPHEFDNDWSEIVAKLRQDEALSARFKESYSRGITRANIIDSLVEYEKTLITPDARFDRYLRGEDNSLSDSELAGYRVFKEVGCVSCHQGINVGGNLYQQFGVFYDYIAERGDISKIDYGRINITGNQSDEFVFKVPSLRNIALTAPYLHDGSAETLEQAIEIMGKTQLGRTLTTEEIEQIKSFLITLTGEFNSKPLEDPS